MSLVITAKNHGDGWVHLILLKQGLNVIEVKLLSVVETTNIICGQLKTLSVQVLTRCSSHPQGNSETRCGMSANCTPSN